MMGIHLKDAVQAEIRARAAHHAAQTRLVTDYYRVRRKLSYPLPVRAIHLARMPLSGLESYPWATWMTWALEERLGCLGWAAEWFGDESARVAAARDLRALAAWPSLRQYDWPDLSLGHAARTLWMACAEWTWPDAALRGELEANVPRFIEDAWTCGAKRPGRFATKDDILALPDPHKALHNIPLIGLLGAALLANVSKHARAEELNAQLERLFGALLDLREHGMSEGVAYDGYVLTFVADWLRSLPKERAAPLLAHPRLRDYFEQSCGLAAPGALADVPELGDVEPVQMPFHISAQAKLQLLQPDPQRAWYLARCTLSRLRADALAAIGQAELTQQAAPPSGALNAHYALVLRSGYERDDLAVAVAASNSPMGHIHHDNDSVTIGSRGRWYVTDPGYQQYMKRREREYTLGMAAHNAPVINGQAQSRKGVRRVALETLGRDLCRAELDLTACYAPELELASVRRSIWLVGKDLVVIADRVRGARVESVTCHWHGHKDAAWWVEDGCAMLYFEDEPEWPLWIAGPQARIEESCVDRLPGSRGQLTLCAPADAKAAAIWWVFSLGPARPEITTQGTRIEVAGHTFTATETPPGTRG